MEELLFNSYTDPIPPVRFDIQQIPHHQNGHSLVVFYDALGYMTPNFALPLESQTILSLLDGNRSVEDILKFSSSEVSKEQVLGYVRHLDEHGLLQSKYFENYSELIETEYEASSTHLSNTAGISYPKDPDEVSSWLEEAFNTHEQSASVKKAKALYAPHIDPRVGLSSYVKAFSAIRDLTPKKVVILATSHYSGFYNSLYQDTPFVISQKTFALPNGEIPTNNTFFSHPGLDPGSEASNKLGITFQDRAHRIEHSIELHLLFLNHIWKHEFEIIPILVGGLDELFYSTNSHREKQVEAFSELLRKEFTDDEDTFFLISGDLSHIGYKFGDQKAASQLFDEVKLNDERFLEIGATGNPDKLLGLMKEEYDPYRICGFPPLLTFLKTFPNLKGEILSYDLWDEREQESAVSFGSIIFN